jgi:predicted Na+-dependent transporter
LLVKADMINGASFAVSALRPTPLGRPQPATRLAGLVLGLVGGRLIGLNRDQAFTVAIELGIKNGTLGLMVTLT